MVHDKRARAKIRSQLLHVHTLAPTLSGSVLGSVQGRGITAVQLVGLARATRWGYSLWELEVLGSCTCNRCNSTEVSSVPPHPVPLPDNKRSELCDTLTAVALTAVRALRPLTLVDLRSCQPRVTGRPRLHM